MAIAGLVLSILGLAGFVGYLVPFSGVVTFIISLTGLILGAVALKKKKSGVAIAALVIGIIGVVYNVPSAICSVCSGALILGAANEASIAGLLVF